MHSAVPRDHLIYEAAKVLQRSQRTGPAIRISRRRTSESTGEILETNKKARSKKGGSRGQHCRARPICLPLIRPARTSEREEQRGAS